MTKLMTLNLSEVQNQVAATSLLCMAKYAKAHLREMVEGPVQALLAIQKIKMLEEMAGGFSANPNGVELMPHEAAALAAALKFFILDTTEELPNIAGGDPRLIIGGIKAMAVAKTLLDEVCDKGIALAEEEEAAASNEAMEQRKAA